MTLTKLASLTNSPQLKIFSDFELGIFFRAFTHRASSQSPQAQKGVFGQSFLLLTMGATIARWGVSVPGVSPLGTGRHASGVKTSNFVSVPGVSPLGTGRHASGVKTSNFVSVPGVSPLGTGRHASGVKTSNFVSVPGVSPLGTGRHASGVKTSNIVSVPIRSRGFTPGYSPTRLRRENVEPRRKVRQRRIFCARGAYTNPWIFAHTTYGNPPPMHPGGVLDGSQG